MVGRGRARVELRAALSEPGRVLRIRGLLVATAACLVLVLAVVTVGRSAGWPVWTLSLALLLPVVVGVVAGRAAYVLHRQRTRPAPG